MQIQEQDSLSMCKILAVPVSELFPTLGSFLWNDGWHRLGGFLHVCRSDPPLQALTLVRLQ